MTLHAFTQRIVNELAAKSEQLGKPVKCAGLGCSACCYEPVYAERREVEHALGRMTPQARAYVKERTVEWLAKLQPSGLLEQEEPLAWDWRALKAPCPFLKLGEGEVNGYQRGHCLIYNDQPIGCRMHMVSGDPSHCFDDELRKRQEFVDGGDDVKRKIGLVMGQQLQPRLEFANLGEWLAKEFGIAGRQAAVVS